MRIIYIANIRLPTEKAHGVQIMKTCEAFAMLGHAVELVVPDRLSAIKEDPFSYYGVTARFRVCRLPVLDFVGWYGPLGFLIESFSFAHAVRKHLRTASFDVLYGRDEHILAGLSGSYIWESHTGAWNVAARIVSRRAKHIVTISFGLKNFYVGKGVPEKKVSVAHDGVDLKQFANPQSKQEARMRLGLPLGTKIVLYVGRLDGWKGVDTLLEASELLTDDIMVVVIGGEEIQVKEYSCRYPKVRFFGFRPYTELKDNMAVADVLVLPNTGKNVVSAEFTSPLKLFAYMTSGIPLVTSDLPSVREVLDERSAFFFQPDNAASLASKVRLALAKGGAQAACARTLVGDYTWERRAKHVLESISNILTL